MVAIEGLEYNGKLAVGKASFVVDSVNVAIAFPFRKSGINTVSAAQVAALR